MGEVLNIVDKLEWNGEPREPVQMVLFDVRPYLTGVSDMADEKKGKILRVPQMVELSGFSVYILRAAMKKGEFYSWKKHKTRLCWEEDFLAWLSQPEAKPVDAVRAIG
jgi:hypothetical protein